MLGLTECELLRSKTGHSETGVATWRGRHVFFKRYESHDHFATELKALDLLRSSAPSQFRFVDVLAACSSSRTLVFPRLLMDASQAAMQSDNPGEVVHQVCLQLIAEIDVTRRLPQTCLPLRAAQAWHFLRRSTSLLGDQADQIVALLEDLTDEQIIFRYDPQLDNFLVQDAQACKGVWSIDFSMWRRMHMAFPFGFLLHDLLERRRPGLDLCQVQPVIESHLADWMTASGQDGTRAHVWLLASRAEALAHEVEGHSRREQATMAQRKLVSLKQVMKELARCL